MVPRRDADMALFRAARQHLHRQDVRFHSRRQHTAVGLPPQRAHRATTERRKPHRVERNAREWRHRLPFLGIRGHETTVELLARVSARVCREAGWVSRFRSPDRYAAARDRESKKLGY